MNSPIKWMGGKYRLRKTIVKMIPEHVCYCEPFGGAGWVLFEKAPSKVEVYNDINSELVNFFRVIKEKPEEFIRAFDYLLISREIFQKYKALSLSGTSDVKRAARFYYLLHFSFGSLMNDFMISPLKKPPMTLERVRENITSVRDRLINTIIENRDVEKILLSYDRPSTFFYCDPPYYGLADYTSQGSKPFSKDDHVRLKENLAKLKGKFLLSINDHPEIRALYSGFNIKEIEVRYSVCRSDKSSFAKELFISNYESVIDK